jgi:hypothetical protein
MALSIIGAGLGRTGTLSLKRAIEQLGFGPCFHGVDSPRSSFDRVVNALERDPVDWEEVFNGYRAAVDTPSYLVYRQLAERYPSAKVILTVREANAWFDSALEIKRLGDPIPQTKAESDFYSKGLSGFFGADIAKIFDLGDRDSAIAARDRHNAEVQKSIPADRLLVLDITQGWKPLCEFLGVPVPDTPFPHANSRKEYPSLLQAWVSSDTHLSTT